MVNLFDRWKELQDIARELKTEDQKVYLELPVVIQRKRFLLLLMDAA